MPVQRFDAHVAAGPRGRAVIAIPFDPDQAWGAKAEHPVAGTISARPVRGTITLDTALTAGPRHGRDGPRPSARIKFTAAGTAEPRQMTARIGYALALAAAIGAPIQVADQVMDHLAVPGPR
jgi:hypothetical protein